MMRTGICLRNQKQLASTDAQQIGQAGFGTVKAFHYHDPVAIKVLGLPVLLRLPDSTVPGRIKGAEEYASECAGYIRSFLQAGVNLLGVQLDCEPNEQAGWGNGAYWAYQSFFTEVFALLKNQVAEINIGFPPVSTNAPLDQWLAASANAMAMADFVCIDAYWQARGDMFNPHLGGLPLTYHHAVPGKPLVVTECGSSLYQTNATDPNRLERWKLEYPVYFAWLATLGYVQAAYIFMQGGTVDWAGFFPPAALYPTLGDAARSPQRYAPFYPQSRPTWTPQSVDDNFIRIAGVWYCIPTQHYISGPILNWYIANGGFTWLGLPLTEQYTCPALAGGLTIQLFQRGRAEIQHNGQVTLGLTMADYYNRGYVELTP